MNLIKYLFFLLLLYLFIYNPPFQFLSVSPVELMIIPAFLYIAVSWKWYPFLKIFWAEILIFLLIALYSYFRDLGSIDSVFFRANILLLLESLVIPYFIILLYSKIKGKENLIKEVIYIGIFASLITLAMIAIPSLNALIRNQVLKGNEFDEFLTFRSFGLAEGLTFAYGIVQGLIFAFVFYYSRQNSKYLVLLPLILLSIFFNARVGMIPVIIAIIYFVIIKLDVKFILLSICFALASYLIIFQSPLFSDYAETIEWAFDFFNQSSDFLTGNADKAEVNTFTTLFGDMAVFPQNTSEWIVGTGENIFLLNQGNSDVGYLIQINYGGLLYMFLIVVLMARVFWRMKFLFLENKWFVILLFLTVVLGNVKGLFISVNPNFRLIMLLFCYIILEHRRNPKAMDNIFSVSNG